jgi:glycosyltransferase involved in cell wall biosynthesis
MTMLATALAGRGFPVRVFALEASGPLRRDLQVSGVEVVDGGYDSSASLLWKLALLGRAQWRLAVNLLRSRATVVHAFLPLAGLLTVVAGRLCGVPRVIVARRALGTHQERHPYWRAIDRMVDRLAHVVTANARAVADDTARRGGVPSTRIKVIPNGVAPSVVGLEARERDEVRSTLGLQMGDIAIVCLANLIAYKGHLDLVEAFGRVALRRPELRLFLVGSDRGVGASLLAQASRLGIASQVVLLGHRDDVAHLLGAMDLGVLASHEEGLSNAILEYLAAGLPVVATDVGGTGEILAGLPGCRLVRARDVDALATALLELASAANDDELRNVRQQSVTRRFSVEAMVERHIELYGFAPACAGR